MRLGVEEELNHAKAGETETRERRKGLVRVMEEDSFDDSDRSPSPPPLPPSIPPNNGEGDKDAVVEKRHANADASLPPGSTSIREMLNYDVNTRQGELTVKIICLGDSAVGKSKLLERFLINSYKTNALTSTYALQLYRYNTDVDEKPIVVDFWDTAGQERFSSLHPSYYHQSHACIMVFDATRKVTYKNLTRWYDELRQYRPEIPCFCAVNKIDANLDITKRQFAFSEKNGLPCYFVSASDGTNVVKLFRDAISAAVKYKEQPTDWQDQVLTELEQTSLTNVDKDNSSTSDELAKQDKPDKQALDDASEN